MKAAASAGAVLFTAGWLSFVLLAGPDSPAQDHSPTPTANPTATLGSVRVDASTRSVIATGWVNQVEDAIELMACGPGGKTHESVFVLIVNPLDLQAGLLLLGLKPGKPLPMLGAGPPEGPELDLWVEWPEGNTIHRERAEHFAYDVETKSSLPDTAWIFTGSTIEDGQFKALAEESLVATYWDPWSIVNIALPCGSNDEILVVNTNRIPPLKTPVTFRFQARNP